MSATRRAAISPARSAPCMPSYGRRRTGAGARPGPTAGDPRPRRGPSMVAHLEAGRPVAVWPQTAGGTARRAGGEVARIRATGASAGATFPLGPDDVLQPVAPTADTSRAAVRPAEPRSCATSRSPRARSSSSPRAGWTTTRCCEPRPPSSPDASCPSASLTAALAYAQAGGQAGVQAWPELSCGSAAPSAPGRRRTRAPELARHVAGDRATYVWGCDDAPTEWGKVGHPSDPPSSAPARARAQDGAARAARGALGPPIPRGTVDAPKWGRIVAQAVALPPGRWGPRRPRSRAGRRRCPGADETIAALAAYAGADLVGTRPPTSRTAVGSRAPRSHWACTATRFATVSASSRAPRTSTSTTPTPPPTCGSPCAAQASQLRHSGRDDLARVEDCAGRGRP